MFETNGVKLKIEGAPEMYVVKEEECISCMACESECPSGAIEMREDIAFIQQELCENCGDCTEVCPTGAIIEQ